MVFGPNNLHQLLLGKITQYELRERDLMPLSNQLINQSEQTYVAISVSHIVQLDSGEARGNMGLTPQMPKTDPQT